VRAQRHLSQGDGARLTAAGAGQVALTPSGEDWLIVLTRVNTTDPTGTFVDEPTVTTYRSVVSEAGESLVAVWEDGPALGYATLRVEGIAAPAGQGVALYSGGV
jgi:hypothetical protein